MQHTLTVRLHLNPCKNFKAFYFVEGEGKTIIGRISKCYLEDIRRFSDLPPDKSIDDVRIEWEQAGESKAATEAEEKATVKATEELLKFYRASMGKHKELDLSMLYAFAEKYGWLFETARQNGTLSASVGEIKRHLQGAFTVKAVLDFKWRSTDAMLRHLLDDMRKAAHGLKGNVNLIYYHGVGFVPEKEPNKGLCLRIRYNDKIGETLSDDIEEFEQDSSYIPEESQSMLTSEALASVAQYISGRNVSWRAVWNGGTFGFEAALSSATAFTLLQTKRPASKSKSQSDQKYCGTPYARMSNHYRGRLRGGHITEETYKAVLAEGKRIRARAAYSYEELCSEIDRRFNLKSGKK